MSSCPSQLDSKKVSNDLTKSALKLTLRDLTQIWKAYATAVQGVTDGSYEGEEADSEPKLLLLNRYILYTQIRRSYSAFACHRLSLGIGL